jgi:hypothetical protein
MYPGVITWTDVKLVLVLGRRHASIRKQHRDIINNRIAALALGTYEALLLSYNSELACRTCKDIV